MDSNRVDNGLHTRRSIKRCISVCVHVRMLLLHATHRRTARKRLPQTKAMCREDIYIYIYAISAASMAVYNNQHCLAGGEYEEFHSATVQSYNNIDWDRDAAEEEREIRLIIAYVVGYRNRFHHSYCFVICYGYWFMIEHLPVDEANMLFLKIKIKNLLFRVLLRIGPVECLWMHLRRIWWDWCDKRNSVFSYTLHFHSTVSISCHAGFFFIFWRSEYFSDE